MEAPNHSDVSNAVVESFIESIRRHPCVYDTKRLDYRDQLRKNNAWEQIRLDCGLSTGTATQGWSTDFRFLNKASATEI
ncbi:hypothetical protein HPB48_015846 [Haemaphysalis longicornis]|uniref:MADF domain-containing protein n=1 Tax=Haemaphysalis longicornis TaxID=44386 RepID=A0A9J6H465_HAELO|nr:hypothetical protein HPB48_015846 [Haemaphysalis longicornis]